jgi:1-acyl-sn-glycerol-3-phosphate acyltransferase
VLSGRKIEYGLIPLGAFGLTACAALLALPGLGPEHVAVLLGLLGFSGGFYIVPINALIQHRPGRRDKGSIIAANAWLSSLGVFLASGAFWVLKKLLGLEPTTIFLVGAAVTFLGTLYAVKLMPDSLLRLVFWMLTHSLYRLRVDGRQNIPERGGALFVCNHLSLADAVLLQAAVERPIRFIMFKGMYDRKWIRPFARVMGVIPISSELRPRDMIKSLQAASDAIRNGEIVCIFAEGQITRIGQMLPFRRGFERIMKDVEAPIIPVALDGVWGSIFSFEQGRFLWKVPRRIPYPVAIHFGPAMPPDATPFAVREAVQNLQADAWQHRRHTMQPLHRAFVRTARRHPRRFALADATTPGITFGDALTRTVFLARRLRRVWQGQEMVGLLLPPSVPGALVNYAALLCGKVPVNLNYTLSGEAIASCVKQCGITTIVTSRKFLEVVKLTPPGEVLFLEELAAKPGAGEKVCALLMAKLLPAAWLENTLRDGAPASGPARHEAAVAGHQSVRDDSPHPDPLPEEREKSENRSSFKNMAGADGRASSLPLPEGEGRGEGEGTVQSQVEPGTSKCEPLDRLATVIFSSGSTGEPKGVMLSHYNVASNIEQLGQVFALGGQDRILGVLPFFHSFGFTGTLCLSAVLGVGVAYHANPLDAKTIGPLVHEHEVTFVLATPTFLQLYMRGCTPEQFGSVKLIMVGAEKLPERLAQAFEDQFGIRPVEGYGTTECSPAVTVNTHDFRAAGFRQVGAKRGKIGHPLPGMSVRIVDPETRQPVPVGQPGLLLVKGPNIMQGYLGRPEKTAEVLITFGRDASPRAPDQGTSQPTPISPRSDALRNLPSQEGIAEAPRAQGVFPSSEGSGVGSADRWYVTGDIAALDEDGFLQITDRLSRFSKIGGEMVPHIKVEEELHELAGATEQTFAVTGVPDEKKGEKLIVLHRLKDDALKPVLEKLQQSDLPNLWKPKTGDFHVVDAFPYLGTGKLDLRKIRELATQLSKP